VYVGFRSQCNVQFYTMFYTWNTVSWYNIFHFLLRYEIIQFVALFSLSIAIQKTKHLNDCLMNLASYIFLTTFQYKCWELLESVYNLKTLNHVYVKWTTILMIWLTVDIRFVYNIRKVWCLVKFIIWMQFYEVYNVRITYFTGRHIYLLIFLRSMRIIFSSRFHHLIYHNYPSE
jgi:hypothetical protein